MNPVPFAPPAVVLLLLAAGSAVAPAVAEEFCVVCSEPPAVYRCQPEAAGPGPSYQLLCLQTLARDGGHASCAVRRGVAPTACDGATPLLVY